jgi:hypothetical protein
MKKFIVFKVLEPEEGRWYLAVCGPYDHNKPEAYGDLTGIDYEADPSTNPDIFLSEYLKRWGE